MWLNVFGHCTEPINKLIDDIDLEEDEDVRIKYPGQEDSSSLDELTEGLQDFVEDIQDNLPGLEDIKDMAGV